MAGTRLGRYDVVKTLARGALTDLLVGRATGMEGFQRHVAIKRLRSELVHDADMVELFVNEARLAAVLHHHNIVQVHDIGDEGGQPYFAMEYVHGVDLRKLLAHLAKRNEQLPLQHVVSIVASAAAALHHAHEQRGVDGQPLNIVHRDVTPGNILVGHDGNVKVVDFGIAKAAIRRIQTDAGVLKGQAPYMSPEQCTGKSVDRRSDVFALGIVLFELATVRRLFKASSEFLTMSAIVHAEVPKPSQYRRDIPPQLESIMLKALARDPKDRFQTAGEMSLALDQIASMVGVGASTTALASYMRLQFGDQKEPWLQPQPDATDEEEDITEITEVDFDGPASGLAPPPFEAVQKYALPRAISPTKSSPIVHARTHAITPVSAEKARLPLPPPRVKPPTRPPPMPTAIHLDRAPTESERAAAVLQPATDPDQSATAIVEPLPVGAQAEYAAPASRRPLWIMAFAIVVAAGAVGTIVLWPTQQLAPAAAPETERANTPEPAPASDEPAPITEPPTDETRTAADEDTRADEPSAETAPAENVEQPSAMNMTMADYERAANPAATSEPAAPAPPVRHVDEPIAKKVAPVKRTPKPPARRTVARPTKKAPKKTTAKKPTWNPDDLFIEDK